MSLKTDFELQYTFFTEYEAPVAAIIVAAGSSTRMGGSKQFMPILSVPVIGRTLLAFQNCSLIRDIIVVAREDDIADIQKICDKYNITKLTDIAVGGELRQDSVQNGLLKLNPDVEYVAVHDGARPLISPEKIKECVEKAMEKGACAVGVKVKDTIKRINIESKIVETPNRDNYVFIQTPQVFDVKMLKSAYEKVRNDGITVTDDCSVCEYYGASVFVIDGSYDNIKITTPEDIAIAESILLKSGEKDD